MAFVKPSVKKTMVDIAQAKIYLRGTKKFGKTTLFRDMILEKYGDSECGALLGMGYEVGYRGLDNINSSQITSWEDLMGFKEWILSDDPSAKKVKIVGIDTVDELIPLVEEEVCRMSEKRYKEKCNSINDAFKGFGRGQAKVVELLKEFFYDVHKSGKGIFAIAHTQLRTVRDKGCENTEGYQILTSNLTTKYEAIFGDIFDYVFTGTIDRAIKDGVATADQRLLYFRGNTRIEAGGRFADGAVSEYIVFEGDDKARKFIDEVENGMKNSLTKYRKPKEDTPKEEQEVDPEYEAYKQEVLQEEMEKAEESKQEISSSDKYGTFASQLGIEFIKKNFGKKDFATYVRNKMAELKIAKVTELEEKDLIDIIRYGHEELGFEIELVG